MIIVEQQITDFLYTNIPQLYNDWGDATTYTYEELTILTSASVVRYGNFYWRSIAELNLGNNPEETEGIWWVKYSPSNRYAMIDQQSLTSTISSHTQAEADYLSTDTQTDIPLDSLVWDVANNKMYKAVVSTNDLPNSDFTDESLWENKSDIIVEFERGFIDTLALGYMETSKVTIKHYDGLGAIIPEATQEIEYTVNENIYDLIDYIYQPYATGLDHTEIIYLKPIGQKVRVAIERNTILSRASCGFMVAGRQIDMGITKNNIPFSFNSYTTIEKDKFGTAKITRRNIEEQATFITYIDKINFSRDKRKIKDLDGKVVLFAMDENGANKGFEFLVTFGIIRNFSMIAEVAEKNIINWTVEETI